MPKRKIETSPAATEVRRELSRTSDNKHQRGPPAVPTSITMNNNNRKQDNYHQASESPPPPTNRLRAPLNFSIESLMAPSQHQITTNDCRRSSPQALHVSRSPSPDGSDAGSSASGSSTSTLGSEPAHYSLDQQQHLIGAHSNGSMDTLECLAASSSSSRSSSRVSSPISPGCHSARTPTTPTANPTGAVSLSQNTAEPMAVSANSLHAIALNGHAQATTDPSDEAQHLAGPSATSNPNTRATATTNTSSSKSSSKGHRSGHSSNSRIKPVCTDSRLAPFECHLDNLELWHRFHPLDTEMIITKQGRRMFPPVRVTFSFNEQLAHQPQHQPAANCNQLQFNPRDRYQVLMDILPYDNKRYRYAYHKSSWQQAGKADPPSPTKLFLHPDGPFTLDQLKRQVISFEKIKLTNNDENKHGYIVLNSMHKYQPRIHLILWRGKESQSLANGPVSLLEQEAHKTFIFSETIFTAVTAYQNHSITKLKIDSNPFAKGFRDSTRLTDLELESMQDLIADGQCPFSPPRAPPPGFPHFLFATQHPQFANGHLQLQQQHHQQHHHQLGQLNTQAFQGHVHPPPQPAQFGQTASSTAAAPHLKQEDATAALLRERTIMALDSFFQQHHHHHHQSLQSAAAADSPTGGAFKVQKTPSSQATNSPHSPQMAPRSSPSQPPSSTFSPAHFANFLTSTAAVGAPPPPSFQQTATSSNSPSQLLVAVPPTSQGAANQNQSQLEQFILQQQQQFAAAMAAAAAGVHQHPAYLQSLFAKAAAAAAQCHATAPPVGSTTPTGPTGHSAKLLTSSAASPPARQQMPPAAAHHHQQPAEQTSPIGLAKSANKIQLQDLNQFLGNGPAGNLPPLQLPVTSSVGGQQQIHLQALMQQQHMQQMAVLAQQHHHQKHQRLHADTQLITQVHEHEAGGLVAARKTSAKTATGRK